MYVSNMEWKGDIGGESELYLLMEAEYTKSYVQTQPV